MIKNHLKPKRVDAREMKTLEVFRMNELEKKNNERIFQLGQELKYLELIDPNRYQHEIEYFLKV